MRHTLGRSSGIVGSLNKCLEFKEEYNKAQHYELVLNIKQLQRSLINWNVGKKTQIPR